MINENVNEEVNSPADTAVDKIAFLVDGEVFWVLDVDSLPFQQRYADGLMNNPSFIDATEYPGVVPFSAYKDGTFYVSKEDLDKPIEKGDPLLAEDGTVVKKLALVSDEKVFGVMWFGANAPGHEARLAGLMSNPTIMDITEQDEVEAGWVWDGESFNPPAEM
jgi:hypothetical protein